MKRLTLFLLLCQMSSAGRFTFKHLIIYSTLHFTFYSALDFTPALTAAWFGFTFISAGFILNLTEYRKIYIYNKNLFFHSETHCKISLHPVVWSHKPPWVCWCCPAWWRWDGILWQQHKHSRTKTDLGETRSGWAPWTFTVVHWSVFWVSACSQSHHSTGQPEV